MPSSHMARVLKGKYFPSSLLDVTINSNASFTWKSILLVRDLIIKGDCKVIGDGKDIQLWRDPWVLGPPKFWVTQREGGDGVDDPVYVKEFMGGGRWLGDRLDMLSNPWEVQAIKRLPIPIHGVKDEWIWSHTNHDHYSVKSAYYMSLWRLETMAHHLQKLMKKKVW